MKKLIFTFAPLFFLLACTQQSEKKENELKVLHADTLITKNEVKDDEPSNELIRLVKFIDSSGYFCDTSLPYPKRKIEQFMFYKMKFEETPLYIHRDPSSVVKGADYCALSIIPFKNCKNIWGYSFLKNGTSTKDRFAPTIGGLIEEFDLPDAASTSSALKEIDRKKSLVFYHTRSFCCSLGNSIFVFNTNSGGFDAALKEFFDEFTKNKGTTIPHNIPCYEDEYSK